MELLKEAINNLESINKDEFKELVKLLQDKQKDDDDKVFTTFLPKASVKKQNEAKLNYYYRNKEKIKEKQHEYVMNNIDEIRERQRLIREKKREEMKPIIEAKKAEKERIKAEKLANKRPRGRPKKVKPEEPVHKVDGLRANQMISPEPKVVPEEQLTDSIEIKPQLPQPQQEIKRRRGRPRKY